MLKSHKIQSVYLVVNCVGLQTFRMPLVHLMAVHCAAAERGVLIEKKKVYG